MRLSAIPGTRSPFANSVVYLHLILWGKGSVAFNSGADSRATRLREPDPPESNALLTDRYVDRLEAIDKFWQVSDPVRRANIVQDFCRGMRFANGITRLLNVKD